MIEKIIFASHNPGKIQEVQHILSGTNIKVISATEAGIKEDIIEDGDTFSDNALIKAKYISDATHEWSLADDSGICIRTLGGDPGVYSARWAGEGASDDQIIKHTLDKMKGKTDRFAWMEIVLALIDPEATERLFTGRVNGTITTEPTGKCLPKLPYDSIFIPEGYIMTFSAMSEIEKNAISHRGEALQKLKKFIANHR